MVSSLRHAVFKNFGKIDYLHYFKRIIKDYETKKWDFDIRTIVKNVKVEIPCPKYICKRSFSKRLCLTILDDNFWKINEGTELGSVYWRRPSSLYALWIW